MSLTRTSHGVARFWPALAQNTLFATATLLDVLRFLRGRYFQHVHARLHEKSGPRARAKAINFGIEAPADSVHEIVIVGGRPDLEEKWEFFLSGL